MKEDKTNEFSFILKPAQYGVGVFTLHDIKAKTYLRLFGDEIKPDQGTPRNKEDLPDTFRQYCLDRGDTLSCPKDFGRMEIGWYLNHSKTPNAHHDDDYNYYASRDIKAGEEVTIDYNLLGEPEDTKEDYYQ